MKQKSLIHPGLKLEMSWVDFSIARTDLELIQVINSMLLILKTSQRILVRAQSISKFVKFVSHGK